MTLFEEFHSTQATPVEKGSPPASTQQSVPPIGIIQCWVARAVYGEDNPRWRQFREWLMSDAPAWFRGLYARHGEKLARWIMPHERLKSVIRRWMDRRIGKM